MKDYKLLIAYRQEFLTSVTIALMLKLFCSTYYKVAKKRIKASKANVLYPNRLTFFYFNIVLNT